MNSQKQLLILIGVSASVASFLGGYLLTQPSASSKASLEQQRGSLIDRFDGIVAKTTPTPLPPGLLQASSDAALSPTNAPDGDAILYYHSDSGYVSRVDLETRAKTLISDTPLSRLTRVIWSQDKNRVITVARSANGSRYSYFDYTTREHGNLGSNIVDVAISPDGNSIAIVRSPGGGEGAIQIADFNGQNLRTVIKTRLSNIKLFWQRENNLAFTASDAEASTESLYLLGVNGDLTQLVTSADGLTVRWSPDGQLLFYSTREEEGIVLRVIDTVTHQTKKLSIQAPAEACAWARDQQSLLCAIQTGGETSVVKVSLLDATVSILFSHLIITPGEVFLSLFEKFLVIQSASDQSIWAVKLTNN